MTIISTIRSWRLQARLKSASALLAQVQDPQQIRLQQLVRLNQMWDEVARDVPIWRQQVLSGVVPRAFKSLDEFSSLVPITRRGEIASDSAAYFSQTRRSLNWRTTGGTTSEPLRFPVWSSEAQTASVNAWLGRSWFGVSPADRIFMIWGHSHLLGSGWGGKVAALRRGWSDRLLGYHRFSAYDLSETSLTRACEAMLRFKPAAIIGYSVALSRFSETNAQRGDELRQLKLKAVIATAEGFPQPDSREKLESLFRCPVVMEYGTVESGVIAHENLSNKYQVLWNDWLIEQPSGTQEGLLITSLYPRAFPLIRYAIGDRISANTDSDEFDQSFARVEGRCNDSVRLANGSVIHSEAFTHAIKPCTSVKSFQVVHYGGDRLSIQVTTHASLSASDEQGIRERLFRVLPPNAEIELKRVERHKQSIAGKTPMILRGEYPPEDVDSRAITSSVI